MSTIRIDLLWDRPPLRANDRRSWPAQARAFADTKDEAIIAIRQARPRPIVGANATLVYRPTNNRRQDADGIYPTLKAVLDALVTTGTLPDDSWVCVPESRCRIEAPDGPAAMWVELDVLTEYAVTP